MIHSAITPERSARSMPQTGMSRIFDHAMITAAKQVTAMIPFCLSSFMNL